MKWKSYGREKLSLKTKLRGNILYEKNLFTESFGRSEKGKKARKRLQG